MRNISGGPRFNQVGHLGIAHMVQLLVEDKALVRTKTRTTMTNIRLTQPRPFKQLLTFFSCQTLFILGQFQLLVPERYRGVLILHAWL